MQNYARKIPKWCKTCLLADCRDAELTADVPLHFSMNVSMDAKDDGATERASRPSANPEERNVMSDG